MINVIMKKNNLLVIWLGALTFMFGGLAYVHFSHSTPKSAVPTRTIVVEEEVPAEVHVVGCRYRKVPCHRHVYVHRPIHPIYVHAHHHVKHRPHGHFSFHFSTR